jgi:hypothetical protein
MRHVAVMIAVVAACACKGGGNEGDGGEDHVDVGNDGAGDF